MDEVSMNDDLLTFGLHSLAALHLLHEIETAFHIQLNLSELIKFRKVKQLSDEISALMSAPRLKTSSKQPSRIIPDPIVKLKGDHVNKTIFLVHPGGGTVFYYFPLIKHLPNNWNIYAIQDPGVILNQVIFSSIEEMATFYVNSILKYQPNGPYFIAGSSFGATVSVEIARQLRQRSKTIAFVGLFDGWAKWPDEIFLDKKAFKIGLQKQYSYFQTQFPSIGESIKPLIDICWHRLQMLKHYHVPEDINFTLTLFKAETLLPSYQKIENPTNHWVVTNNAHIKVYIIKGDHFTLHIEPNVTILAIFLQKSLKDVI